jgi:2-polyprenyl-3-methyl-5-hydroxy-6-metoxy-1,4-benzoquinol methylase
MKNDKQYLKSIVTIEDSDVDVEKIIDNIKQSIKKNRVKHLQELGKKLPGTIDAIASSEYLLRGWHKKEMIGEKSGRWTQKEFSLLFNSNQSDTANLEIIALPPDIDEKPLRISLKVNGKKIDEKKVNRAGIQIITFNLPKKYLGKNIILDFSLSRTFTPVEKMAGSDIRKLGIAVSKVTNQKITALGSEYLPELVEFQSQAPLQLEKIKYHVNPENKLPHQTRAKFFKKLILRVIKVYTSVQIGFNIHVQEFLSGLTQNIQTITAYLKDLDAKVHQLEKDDEYQPLYWDKEKDDFYSFHQENFRGKPSEVKQNFKHYLDYLNSVSFYTGNPFIDFGCGRGEFLELLKQKNINSFGVDINSNFIDLIRKKEIIVKKADAIEFIKEYPKKIGGMSAFHLLEHFSFPQLFDFLKLAHQKLKIDGKIFIETPNPDNLIVAGEWFYYDYTHQTKLPPELLKNLFDYIGFKNIKIIPLHPIRETNSEIEERIFGPQDYALIATK